MIERLQQLDTEIVETFLETREHKPLGIPETLANYILEINTASNLFKRFPAVTDCARELQKQYPKLSLSTCKSRVYDALNYLHADCTVTSQAWNMYYADQFEKLAQVNLVARNFKEVRECKQKAKECRLEASASAVDPSRTRFKHILVSPDYEVERMGVKKQGILTAYAKAKAIINARDIPTTEKERCINETAAALNITEAEYEGDKG